MNSGMTKMTLTVLDESVGAVLRLLTDYKAQISDLSPVVDVPFHRNKPRRSAQAIEAPTEPERHGRGARSEGAILDALRANGEMQRPDLVKAGEAVGIKPATVLGLLQRLKKAGKIANVAMGRYALASGNTPTKPTSGRIGSLARAEQFRSAMRKALISGEQSLHELSELGEKFGLRTQNVSQTLTHLIRQKKVRRVGKGTYQIRRWKDSDNSPAYAKKTAKPRKKKNLAAKIRKLKATRKAKRASKLNGHKPNGRDSTHSFGETGNEMVLRLLDGGKKTTTQIQEAWLRAGRSKKAFSVQLSQMLKKSLIARPEPGVYSLPATTTE